MHDVNAGIEGATSLPDMSDAWAASGFTARMNAVMKGARALRERFDSESAVVSVRTLPLATAVYPTKFAYWGTAFSPAPYVTLTLNALLIQFRQRGQLKNLLFEPTDVEGAKRTPFYARVIEQYGPTISKMLAKTFDPVETQLAEIGVAPEDIDYVTFDHFHVQDLRSLLGTTDGTRAARFPNARLVAQAAEWNQWDDASPIQRAWFVPDGKEGVDESRIAFVDGCVQLGEGVMLVHTPGHTAGNQTLFFKTKDGVWGTSENGSAADNWSPEASKIPGVAKSARREGVELVLNANTRDDGQSQYISMSLEKSIVDKAKNATDFVQMFPSSQVRPSILSPFLSPTHVHRDLVYGDVELREKRVSAPAKAKRAVAAVA
jgi:hypothetical protein